MASITDRIMKFARSPRGQRLVPQGQRDAARPENQRRLGPVSKWMAGLRRTQAPPGTTPVTAGYNPGIRPRPARPQPTPEPRLAPTPTLIRALGQLRERLGRRAPGGR